MFAGFLQGMEELGYTGRPAVSDDLHRGFWPGSRRRLHAVVMDLDLLADVLDGGPLAEHESGQPDNAPTTAVESPRRHMRHPIFRLAAQTNAADLVARYSRRTDPGMLRTSQFAYAPEIATK
jgi:hypothetical protein